MLPLLLLVWSGALSQHSLRLRVTVTSALQSGDSLFVAGNFNSWDPGSEKFRLVKSGDHYEINIPDLKPDIYEFKFTRGSWKKGEVAANGSAISNRLVRLASDTTVEYVIADWADHFKEPERTHSASANVRLWNTAFYSPELKTARKIWVYLPPGYEKTKKKYPVLYMHDGQNLFDNFFAPFGEWGVDECLDSLIARGTPACIVVGIESNGRRVNEYNPYNSEAYGPGEGDAYLHFITETLKPAVDSKLRTLPAKSNTYIAGSSMGGLISYYAMLRYPGVFGKAGIFSPSFWIAPGIKPLTDSVTKKINGQFFFFAGALEPGNMLQDMEQVAEQLGANSSALIYTIADPNGKHNEQSWRAWFDEFYCWISGNGLNYQIKIID